MLLILTFFIFAGCSTNIVETNSVKNGISSGELLLEEAKESDLPKELLDQSISLSQQRGYSIYKHGENEYILFVALGEKNTAGFDLSGKEITINEDGQIQVIIEEKEPGTNEMVAEVITYPHKFFWIKGEIADIDKVTVLNQKGIAFAKILDQKADGMTWHQGIYIGQIDTHSIEIQIGEEAKAFQILDVKESFEALQLNDGDSIEFTYINNENGQLVIKELKKK